MVLHNITKKQITMKHYFEFGNETDVYFGIDADTIKDAIQQALDNVYDTWADELEHNQALTSFDAITRIYDCDCDKDLPTQYLEQFKLNLDYTEYEVKQNHGWSEQDDLKNEWHQELDNQIQQELMQYSY